MKRTQKKAHAIREENTKPKWVVAKVHPTNDHFQFLRRRKWWDWVNHPGEAAIFDSRFAACRALSIHQNFNYASGAFVATLS